MTTIVHSTQTLKPRCSAKIDNARFLRAIRLPVRSQNASFSGSQCSIHWPLMAGDARSGPVPPVHPRGRVSAREFSPRGRWLNRPVHVRLDGVRRQLDLRAASAVLAAGDEVTMDDVAAHLRVAKPTLYRLAGSKAQLIRACIDAEAERL